MLRPDELVGARARRRRGETDAATFKAIEDRAVDRAIQVQQDAGLDVVTDGEMRRLSFQSQMTEAVEGFSDWDLDAFLWGDWQSEELGEMHVDRPELAVESPLRRRRSLCGEEYVYARARAARQVKVTLPSPSLFASFWDPDRSSGVYETLDDFLQDAAEVLREEVDELASLGCTYLQIDAPHYALLVDPQWRQFYASRGWPAEQWLERGMELDNHVMAAAREVTFGFHLCRGNQASRWLVQGGYEWLADRMFRRIDADRLLLEYDDARSGGFEPLGRVPEDKVAVLGLVTTKTGRRETAEQLETWIREASRHIALERLAVSPQCGFATSVVGNALAPEDEAAKLAVLATAAQRVWGA
jgi:5-methyltetrahydropteroyltriglutamate--homocysteine methyltransferase